MFPEETHVKIVKRIDQLEADAYRLYRQMERLRLELQEQWKVLPDGSRWSQKAQIDSIHSGS